MIPEADHTLPGVAGLYYRTEALTEAGWQQEHTARSILERWCHSCGQRACYGYGETLASEGVLSCADPDCRSSAELQIAQRNCPSPPAKPSDDTAEPDLFGRAA